MKWTVLAFAAAAIALTTVLVAQSPTTGSSGGDPILVGAGDIADKDSPATEDTAALIEEIDGTVFTVGDNVQGNGSPEEFDDYYDPAWGQFKDRTKPAVGNHEYYTEGAENYYEYFGAAAGDPEKGYYSYNLGEWHIVVLNTMCEEVGGCADGSPQLRWLEKDLAENRAKCTLAMGHHPLFSSGEKYGGDRKMKPTYEILYDAGVDVVLSGSEGNYERFAPQDAEGNADPRGLRQFVVATGGHFLSRFGDIAPNSQVRNGKTHGVLKMTLHPESYEWEFVPIEGRSFTDSGSADCNG